MPDVNHWRDERRYRQLRFKASQKQRFSEANGATQRMQQRDAERKRAAFERARGVAKVGTG